jgi:hypothetical protein
MNKINIIEILEKHKMVPKHKAWINMPLYMMISMPVLHPTLKIDVLNLVQTFHFGYWEGDKVFYVSPLEWKG